ncbi:MAG: hypothetical protein ACKVQC_04690 [Elusimicrobiota bacterium]
MINRNSIRAALILFLLALSARVFSSSSYFFQKIEPGFRNFEIFDSTYHMRRVEITLDQYPKVPFKDTYHYFPQTPDVPWPPGYTLFLATLALPLKVMGASPLTVQTFVGFMPCVFDSFSVLLFFFFILRYMSLRTAFIASLLYALSYQNVGYSELGYIDHHYFINLLIMSGVVLMAWFHEKPGILTATLFGSLVGLMSFFNVSSIQFGLFILFTFSLSTLFFEKELFKLSCFSFITAIIFSCLAGLSTPVGGTLAIRYDQTSLFQALLILFLFLIHLIGYVFLNRNKFSPTIKTLFYGVLMLVLLGVSFKIIGGIKEGAQFLLVGNVLNSIQGEEVSIKTYYPLWISIFTLFVLMVPFGTISFFRRNQKPFFFFAICGIFFFYGILTGFSHFLYVQYLFPWMALQASIGFWLLWDYCKSWKSFRLVIFAPFFIQLTHLGWTQHFDKRGPEISQRNDIAQTMNAFGWLRDHTPSTSYQKRGDGPPEYSVFAHRDHGHMIARIAQRPTVISPFSTPDFLKHMQDYARLTLTMQETEALEIMSQYQSRYLVLDNRDNTMIEFLKGVLKGEADFSKYAQAKASPFLLRNNLLYFDGELRWKKTPPVEHFRLVYEVPKLVTIPMRSQKGTFEHRFNGLKIFEKVTGAKIVGKNYKPGERVMLQLILKSNTDRQFNYTHFSIANEKGQISMTVPYATHEIPVSATKPLFAYQIMRSPTQVKSLLITEKQIEEGAVVECNAF